MNIFYKNFLRTKTHKNLLPSESTPAILRAAASEGLFEEGYVWICSERGLQVCRLHTLLVANSNAYIFPQVWHFENLAFWAIRVLIFFVVSCRLVRASINQTQAVCLSLERKITHHSKCQKNKLLRIKCLERTPCHRIQRLTAFCSRASPSRQTRLPISGTPCEYRTRYYSVCHGCFVYKKKKLETLNYTIYIHYKNAKVAKLFGRLF